MADKDTDAEMLSLDFALKCLIAHLHNSGTIFAPDYADFLERAKQDVDAKSDLLSRSDLIPRLIDFARDSGEELTQPPFEG